MHIRALERVTALQQELADADLVLQAFRTAPPRVECFAVVEGQFQQRRRATVSLPPVDSAIAIASAEAARQRIVTELASLGVTVDPLE